MLILAMYVLNFYKKKTKLIRLFISFGKRVFSDLHHIYVDKIFRREPILEKSGSISKEQTDIYMNAFLS